GPGMWAGAGGSIVSPDGDLAVIASRDGTTQSVVVDLRSRTFRGVLHYPPGWPLFVFSSDGRRVYAAGLRNASVLYAWRLPEDEIPRQPRWWTHGMNSRSGGSSLILDNVSGRFEYYRPDAKVLVASGVRGLGTRQRLVGDLAQVAF